MSVIGQIFSVLRRRRFAHVEDMIKFYIALSDGIISFGLFSAIFFYKLGLARYFGSSDLSQILLQVATIQFWENLWRLVSLSGAPGALWLTTYVWFLLYRGAVRRELPIATSLFTRTRTPHDVRKMTGRHWLPVLAVTITLSFLGMAWFVDNMPVYCTIVICLNFFDIRGNNVIRQNLQRYLNDSAFAPDDRDPEAAYVNLRRSIARIYWLEKPQLERIGFMMILVNIAFLVSVSDKIIGYAIWPVVSYGVMIAAIVINETTMARWRRERDRGLDKIALQQEAAIRRLTGETEPPPPQA